MADYLAKGRAANMLEGVWITQPPDSIRHLISKDLAGKVVLRDVRVSGNGLEMREKLMLALTCLYTYIFLGD